MQFKILALVNKFAFIFKFFNIDYDEVKHITEMKLLAGSRKSPLNIQENNNKNEKENKFNLGLFFLLLFGFFMGIMINQDANIILNMAIMSSVLIFYMVFYFLSEFTSIFLNLKDKRILSVLPVKAKSISVAKVLYSSIHLSLICLALTFGWYIIGAYKHNLLFCLALFISTILIIILCVTITTILYGLLMKKFNGDKLNEIVNNMQVIATVVFMIGYQVVLRLFDFVNLSNDFELKVIHFFIPTTWYGGIFSLIVKQNINFNTILLSALGISVPIILIYINQNYILPNFEKNLSKLENVSMNNIESNKESIISRIIPFTNKVEEASFYLSKKVIKNDKNFKIRIASSLSMAFIFPLIFIFSGYDSDLGITEFLDYLKDSKKYHFLYFFNLILLPSLSELFYSKDTEASYIFKVLPIDKPSDINKGLLKAFNMIYVIPLFSVLTLIFSFLFGIKILPFVFLIFVNLILSQIILLIFLKKGIPFSEIRTDGGGERIEISILSFGIMAFFGFIYYTLNKIYPLANNNVIFAYSIINILLIIFLWKTKMNYNWEKLNKR